MLFPALYQVRSLDPGPELRPHMGAANLSRITMDVQPGEGDMIVALNRGRRLAPRATQPLCETSCILLAPSLVQADEVCDWLFRRPRPSPPLLTALPSASDVLSIYTFQGRSHYAGVIAVLLDKGYRLVGARLVRLSASQASAYALLGMRDQVRQHSNGGRGDKRRSRTVRPAAIRFDASMRPSRMHVRWCSG